MTTIPEVAPVAMVRADKRGVQSIDVGLRILDALVRSGGALSLNALGRASGVPVSSCHRYLASFIRAGYAVQDPASGLYDLGAGVVRAGLAALRRADPVMIGLRTCERLAKSTGHTAQLAIWSDEGPVIVSWRMGRVPVATNLAIGSRLPLLRSATGRAFLAHLPRARWEGILRREGATPESAVEVAGRTRDMGYASVDGSVIPGLSAAAAPLLDARGEAALVVALLTLDRGLRPHDIDQLVAEAAIGSSELGGGEGLTI